jgi:CBS domain containing-hemolysin-like protein
MGFHALVALAHGALANVRISAVREQAESGSRRARRLLKLADQPDQMRLTYLLVTTTLQVAITGLAILNITTPALTPDGLPPWLAYTLTAILTITATLVVGELVPEAFGTLYADRLAAPMSGVLRTLLVICRPFISVMTAFSRVISATFGGDDLVNRVTEEEIMTLVDAAHTGGTIEEGEREMIDSVLSLNQTQASELMVPRIDIVAVEQSTPLDSLDRVFIQSGYSRLPVYEGTIDNVRGILVAKDLLMAHQAANRARYKTASDLMRPAHFVPESKPANDLLKEMRQKRVHIAIVLDEYGGTAGLLTIEDLIEQIVGDIRDEYDDDEEAEWREMGEDEYLVEGGIDIDDLNDLLDTHLPSDESDTLAGLIYAQLGRVPTVGETVPLNEQVTAHIHSLEGRRIRKVTVKRLRPDPLADDDTADKPNKSPAPTEADTPDAPHEKDHS